MGKSQVKMIERVYSSVRFALMLDKRHLPKDGRYPVCVRVTHNYRQRYILHGDRCSESEFAKAAKAGKGEIYERRKEWARDVTTGRRLKDEGVVAGVADLFLSVPSGPYHGLYIEMKTENGVQAKSQKEFQVRVEAVGYRYEVCRSVVEFMSVVNGYITGNGQI